MKHWCGVDYNSYTYQRDACDRKFIKGLAVYGFTKHIGTTEYRIFKIRYAHCILV